MSPSSALTRSGTCGDASRHGTQSTSTAASPAASAPIVAHGSAHEGNARLPQGLGQPAVGQPPRTNAPAVAPAQARRSSGLWLLTAVVVLGGGVLVALLAGAGLFALSGQLGGPKVATYPVGDSPRALLFDGQSIWVMNALGATLSQLNATATSHAESAP